MKEPICFSQSQVCVSADVSFEFPTSVFCPVVITSLQTGSKIIIKPYFNQSGIEVVEHALNLCSHLFLLITVNMTSWNSKEKIRNLLWRIVIAILKRTLSVSEWDPDLSHHWSHIWGDERTVVRVSKQYWSSSLLTWHNQRGGAVLCLGLLCSGGQWAVLLQIQLWLSCHVGEHLHRTPSSKDANKFTTLRKDQCECGCNVPKESLKRHLEIMIMSDLQFSAQASHFECDGADSQAKKCNPNQLQGEASLIKNVQTLVYCYTLFQWLLSALKEEPDTADPI